MPLGRAFPRPVAILIAVVSPLALGLFAQTPAPTAPPPQTPASSSTPQDKPVFRTGADLVRVDVVVLDKDGAPVSTLTENDFELQEDGNRQEIRSFQYVLATGLPDADNELSLPIRSRSHAAVEASKDSVRVFLIFWDEYHIGQMASANRARQSLMQFVRSAFGPTDIVAFMDPLTPIDSLWFTRDRLELAERVRKLIGRSGVYVPTRSAAEDAQLERGDVERLRSEVTISAIKAAAVHLGGLRDGRKSIILVSEGLRGMMRDSQFLITDLVRTANDNNTAIFAIDPRGFGQQRFPSLFEGVAADTGGEFFRSNDLLDAFRKVVRQSSGFYLLGYQPAERAMDGRFHKIRVRVKTGGYEVRARSGYWAPSVAEVARARAQAAAADIPADIRRALGELPEVTSRRTVDLWIGATVESGKPMVRMAWSPRASAPASSGKPATLSVVARLGDARAFEGDVDAAGAAFEAPPGALRITVNVEDGAGEVIDRDVRVIEVPDPAAPALWIGSPAVFRFQNVREYRAADRTAVPFAGREFLRTDRLLIQFEVRGAGAAGAKVSAKIMSQSGKDMSELPLTRATEGGRYELDLPLSSVARGEFLVALTAAAGSESVRTLVPFRVIR
jgi:VWFA-related protein